MKHLLLLLSLTFLLSAPSSFNQAEAAELQTQVINVNNGTLPRNGVRVPFLQVNLRAVGGNVEIKSLNVSRSGLSSSDDFGRIWAQTDSYRRTNSRRLTNNDQVNLSFRSPLVVRPGENERLTVYANLNFSSGGRTAALNLEGIESNSTEAAVTPRPEVEIKSQPRMPIYTTSPSRYNRQQFKISCKNQKCQLVPRN